MIEFKDAPWRNKKPGGEEANPDAGFLDINLVSSRGGAVSHQLSAVSSELENLNPMR